MAQVEGLNTEHVVCTVVERLDKALEGVRPEALLCFAGSHLEHELVLQHVTTQFPGIPLAGCSTCGELSSDLGFSEDSLALLAFVSDSLTFATAMGQKLSRSPQEAVQQAVSKCRQQLGQPVALCLAFPDGASGKADQTVQELSQLLGPKVPLFGGVAGHLIERPGPDHVFSGAQLAKDAVSLLCIAGPVHLAMAISHSWRPLSEPELVIEARGPKLLRVGERTAQEYYRSYLGKHATPSSQFPLAVYDRPPAISLLQESQDALPADSYFIRSPFDLGKDDDSIIFAGDVPSGAYVGVTEATPQRVLEDTRASAARLAGGLETSPSVALVFSCAARKDILGTRTRKELDILRDALPEGTPLFGFYTFGEIGPTRSGLSSHLHNCTMLLLLLGEEGYAPDYRLAAPPPQEDLCNCELSLSQENLEVLRQEVRFAKERLARSEQARARLEHARDMDAALFRTMNQELQELSRELARSEEKYRRIVETTGEGFLFMDQEFVIQYANEAYCRLIGYPEEEIVGKRPLQLMTEKYRDYVGDNAEEITAKDYRRFSVDLQHKDGHPVPVLVNGNILRDSQGAVLGHVAFVTDMSEQKKALLLAGKLQQSLMPGAPPEIPGLDVAGRSEACEEVGGDFYDYRSCGESPDDLIITVADISGHGVDAALLMSAARAFLRMRAAQPGGLEKVVSEMNRHLAQDLFSTGRFLTLLTICVNANEGSVSCVRAGHDPPLVYDPKSDAFSEFGSGALPLGVDQDTEYTVTRLPGVAAGSVLVIGTDGIWEAGNKAGEMFGKGRLREVIRANADKTAQEILDAVFKAVEAFGRGVKAEDDRTLVIVKLS